MIVFRVCTYEEARKIIESNGFDGVGKSGLELVNIQQRQNVNNHVYNYRKNYLHFYEDKSSIFYLSTENKCICTYNIPDEILLPRKGEGYYLDLVFQKRILRIPEYAIDTEELSFDYLEAIQYVEEYIDLDDYYFDNTLSDSVQLIYQKDKGIKRERRVS